jgi:lipoprotein signal peptidase
MTATPHRSRAGSASRARPQNDQNYADFLIAAAVVADQLTKAAALSLLSQGTAVPVLPGFNLSLGFNEGASFGMMGGSWRASPC